MKEKQLVKFFQFLFVGVALISIYRFYFADLTELGKALSSLMYIVAFLGYIRATKMGRELEKPLAKIIAFKKNS